MKPMKSDKVEAYIQKSADFAKPILKHFRSLVFSTCPDVVETYKWSFPFYTYRGKNMCHMAAFKAHCAIGFWHAALMKQSETLLAKARSEEAMGHLGKISSLKDLPKDKELIAYIKESMRLIEAGIKAPAKPKKAEVTLETPDYFKKELIKNPNAKRQFEAFASSHKKEYIRWISEAKTEETRNKRMHTSIEWIAEGKDRNWKYRKKK